MYAFKITSHPSSSHRFAAGNAKLINMSKVRIDKANQRMDRMEHVSGTTKHRPTSRTAPAGLQRRQFLLSSFVVPGVLGDLLKETVPETGTCPTCIGAVDGTLGSCAGVATCYSSYDDRPQHFLTPWEYNGPTERAIRQLISAVREAGAIDMYHDGPYLYAAFNGGPLGGIDDLEFLFADNDNTVALRASSRLASVPDFGRNEARLRDLRLRLGWELVPIIRNRQRAFGIIESPFDSFGPVPPPSLDFNKMDLEPVNVD